MEMSVVAGPWGGTSGEAWDDGSHDGIREMTISYGGCIDSIKVVYDVEGKSLMSDEHGGVGPFASNHTIKITLNYPDEFLMSVSGHYSSVAYTGDPMTVIRSLTLKSNLRTFGPFGMEEGIPFSLDVQGEAHIVGFFGRSGCFLDAIGFRVSSVKRKNVQKYFENQRWCGVIYGEYKMS